MEIFNLDLQELGHNLMNRTKLINLVKGASITIMVVTTKKMQKRKGYFSILLLVLGCM